MSDLRVEDLVASLCEEGVGESAGRSFTLDLSQAMQRMRGFQLENPFEYCLKWLQAAGAGGADHFVWTSDLTSARASIFNLSVEPDRLRSIPYLLFEAGSSPVEKHLSAGLNAVIKTKARRFSIWSFDGTRGNHACWTAGRFKESDWRPEKRRATPQLHLEVQRSRSDWLSEWWYMANTFHVGERRGSRNARDREQQLLHQRGALANPEVSIQGHRPEFFLRPPRNLWTMLQGMNSLSDPIRFRTAKVVPAKTGGFRVDRLLGQSQQQPCRLLIATPSVRMNYSMLQLVREGVILAPEKIFPGRPGKVFLACANELKVDLSGLRAIHDASWEALLAELERRLEEADAPG